MIFVYFVALLSGILWGITESINKSITEKKYSSFSYFMLQAGLNLIIYTFPFILYGSLPRLSIAYLYVSISVMFIFLSNLFMIKAYKTEDISNINILSRSSLVITFLSGVILLQEKITLLSIVGVAAIVLGIIVIFYRGEKLSFTSGFLFALSAGVLFGLNGYLRKMALFYFDPLSIVFFIHVLLVTTLLFIPQSYKDLKSIFAKYKRKIIFSRFTAVIAFYLINWSFSRGNISISNTNYETAFLLSTAFIGIWVLGEKKQIAKKLAGSLFCILGIILLNFF